ncbi:MAG: DNA primase [Bacillota bacterium]|nr:DNA primase [Bacillota bacterium]
MPRNIPDTVVEEIRIRADIVDIISQFVSLAKKGKNFEGLCPFHHEKTPSFKVNKEKQIYYCFGCGVGGDVFSFLMNIEKLTFPEAIEKLANQYNVHIPEEELSQEEQQKRNRIKRLIEANQLAVKYFNYLINQPQGSNAKKYLLNRGLTEELISQYSLGYAPNSWEGFYHLAKSRGFSEDELVEAGLIVKKDHADSFFDRFRNRIIFSIYNHSGQPIGFGGRVLDDSMPKYLNTAETIIFNKSNILYGLNWAGSSIRAEGYAIVMEGYMDALAAYQYGIENVVASLGTAFTKEHAMLLKRYTNRVVICYDSDTAGQKATLRGLSILKDENFEVKVISLPAGLDPDDFIRKHGKETFIDLAVNKALSLIQYKLEQIINTQKNKSSDWQVKAFDAIKPDLLKTKNAIEREQQVRLISDKLQISIEAIGQELQRIREMDKKNGIYRDKKAENRNTIYGLNSFDVSRVSSALETAEKQLFFFMVEDKADREAIIEKLGEDFFSDPLLKQLYTECIQCWDMGNEVKVTWLLTKCSTKLEQKEIAKIFSTELPEHKIKDKLIDDCVQAIKQKSKKAQINYLRKQLKEAEAKLDFNAIKQILKDIQQLMNH